MENECRNCGRRQLQDLGYIGRIAPFFLKRVFGIEMRPIWSTNPLKRMVRSLAGIPMSVMQRALPQFAHVEMQICSDCSFIQTKRPFHDEDIARLYADYREPSYHSERTKYEPEYAAIADAVGYDAVEIRTRTTALNAFLRNALGAKSPATILDYGGSDGRFLPDLAGAKFVYDVSKLDPVPGVTRINSESALSRYSLVLLAHVTEHVPHPLNLVRKLHSYVEPGGYLYIETPQDVSDEQRDGLRRGTLPLALGIHEHINYYFASAVSSLLESAGFAVVALEATPVDVGWAKSVHIRALGQRSRE